MLSIAPAVLILTLYAGWNLEQPVIKELREQSADVDVRPLYGWRLEALLFPDGFAPPSIFDRVTRVISQHEALKPRTVVAIGRLTYAREIAIFRGGGVRGPDVAAWEDLSRLEYLALYNLPEADAALPHVARLPRLRTLVLVGSDVTDDGLAPLSQTRVLRRLELSKTRVGDRALVHVSAIKGLRELYVWNTKVTDAGLAQLERLPDLESLMISGTALSDAGVDSLLRVRSLEFLDVQSTRLTDQGVERLRRGLPRIKEMYSGEAPE
jgi:hypothetical protein